LVCLSTYSSFTNDLLTVYSENPGDMTEHLQHRPAIGGLSAWLIWERRRELLRMSPRPAPLFLLLMIPFAVAWLASDIADIYEGRQFALMGMIQVFLLSLLGWRIYKFLLFPLSYLVPTGEFLLPWLQQLAADMTTRMIELTSRSIGAGTSASPALSWL